MTQEQKDAVWVSLPDYYKTVVMSMYSSAITAYNQGFGYGMMLITLEDLFGKHNLTATEEDKTRFKVGNCVKVHISTIACIAGWMYVM